MLNNQILYEKKNRFLASLQKYGKLTTLCLSGVQSDCVSSEQAWVLQPALSSVHPPPPPCSWVLWHLILIFW